MTTGAPLVPLVEHIPIKAESLLQRPVVSSSPGTFAVCHPTLSCHDLNKGELPKNNLLLKIIMTR